MTGTQVIFRTLVDDADLESRIKEISSQDLLTGLFNRQYFVEALDTAVDQATNGERTCILMYVEIDHFSRIRSEAGISNADLVLGDVATLIRNHVPDEHLMARFGDDVFSILFNDGDKEKAGKLAESVRALVEGHMSEVSGKTYQMTVSIGLSLISENSPTSEEVISRAHQATDSIEDNGVNFYQPKVVTVGEEGKSLTSEHIKDLIRRGIKENNFKLMYQPIISLHGEDDEQFEVLLRLPDDDGNELLPGQFLGPAVDAGLLEKIDRWVILNAVKALAEHRAEADTNTRLFINVTHKSIADDTFLPWMSVALKAARLPSDAVILQVHENDAISYIKQATKFAKGMSELHCKTSINHFGCSLNPFNLLKHLTPDFVKLDGSFAQQLDDNEKQAELVDMVKSLQTAGVLTAISGVEEPGTLPTLWQAGINFIQGFYISPPLENMEYDFSDEDM